MMKSVEEYMQEASAKSRRNRNWSVYSLRFTIVILCLFLFVYSRLAPRFKERIMQGETMGTTYTIKVAKCTVSERVLKQLQATIDGILNEVNQQMSIYRPGSEISLLNQAPQLELITVSPALSRVLRFSLDVAEQTEGAFDPTVKPLVNLWGFGPDGRRATPSDSEIEAAKEKVGFQYIKMQALDQVQKMHPDIQLDLGAVAKGYAVDKVSQLLFNLDYRDHLVEIGGEMRSSGLNQKGKKWRIGIQKPNYAALPGLRLEGIVELSDQSMATSGDYQNFYEDEEGQVYAHIIDPRTGYPAGHTLASVTVLARACMPADALATATYVLGPEDGLALIEAWDGVEALFVVRQEDGRFVHKMSSGFLEATGFRVP